MSKKFKILLIILSLSLAIVPISYAAYLYTTTKGAVDLSFSKNSEKSALRDKAVDPSMDHISILFLGIDDSISRRENGQKASQARTDAMILATFDRSDKQIRLVSIPRDTLAYIPSVKYYDKITHAHAEGGPESSKEAVEQLFNVPVDYYARVNMQAFVDIVDELGGIEFDVPFDIDEPTKLDKGRIKVKAGQRVINGDEALALVRSRHVDTDLGRGKRQMQMIEAIVKKAKDTNSLDKLDNLVEIVGNNAKHNLTFNNITSLASYYTTNDVKFKKTQLKGTDYMYNGVYYYNPVLDDIYKISKLLRKDLELPEEKKSDLLDAKVIALKGNLIPLETIDIEKIEKAYKELKDGNKEKATEHLNTTETPNNTDNNVTNEAVDLYTTNTAPQSVERIETEAVSYPTRTQNSTQYNRPSDNQYQTNTTQTNPYNANQYQRNAAQGYTNVNRINQYQTNNTVTINNQYNTGYTTNQ
ncbi:LCP family protein [Macrococcus caseolyticus]|nr:LCP family protein [Macrococcus caseolyticus]MCE4955690.1 LCP family protein [Macrococcus caseolyticus]